MIRVLSAIQILASVTAPRRVLLVTTVNAVTHTTTTMVTQLIRVHAIVSTVVLLWKYELIILEVPTQFDFY
jgi:hypothetical protein